MRDLIILMRMGLLLRDVLRIREKMIMICINVREHRTDLVTGWIVVRVSVFREVMQMCRAMRMLGGNWSNRRKGSVLRLLQVGINGCKRVSQIEEFIHFRGCLTTGNLSGSRWILGGVIYVKSRGLCINAKRSR